MIGLIVPSNLRYAPYVQYYINAFRSTGTRAELISWDKRRIDEDVDFSFRFRTKDSNRVAMFTGHLLFSAYAAWIVRRRRYERLVVFTVAPSIFMSSLLLKHYPHRYVLDIRDASPLVRACPVRFRRVVDSAKLVVASSPRFESWIQRKALLCHNIDVETVRSHSEDPIRRPSGPPYRIACAGLMREADSNIEFIRHTCDSGMFLHTYIGPDNHGMDRIRAFAERNDIMNVRFLGAYRREEIVDLYQRNADFVNIVRSNRVVNSDALPNRLYDAVAVAKPVIVLDHDTAVVQYVRDYELGIVLAPEDMSGTGDVIAKKLERFSYERYELGRRRFIDMVLSDQEAFQEALRRFASSTEGGAP